MYWNSTFIGQTCPAITGNFSFALIITYHCLTGLCGPSSSQKHPLCSMESSHMSLSKIFKDNSKPAICNFLPSLHPSFRCIRWGDCYFYVCYQEAPIGLLFALQRGRQPEISMPVLVWQQAQNELKGFHCEAFQVVRMLGHMFVPLTRSPRLSTKYFSCLWQVSRPSNVYTKFSKTSSSLQFNQALSLL